MSLLKNKLFIATLFSTLFFVNILIGVTVEASSKECKKNGLNGLTSVKILKSILQNSNLEFLSHPNVLAMNVQYQPISNIRSILAKAACLDLKFFDKWNTTGEAHITTLTPPEMEKLLINNQKFMTSNRVDEIAKEMKIQNSSFTIEGIGSGSIILNGKPEATFFLIVKSEDLLQIRRKVHKEFVANGGDPKSWNADWFFPHITIGFTLRDLHENDGILKDMKHSEDKRFTFYLEP